ncbi:hypothetical protein M231_03490 [Tremella mesenterica]|uniref:Uncharacterized protein n=1 Tax=Tremella mesenterica TaxID=5217 RepID=A0A4Q1BND9_TREME|nr:hypothetical protein M231_03490 [Tremella mesenterica]
MFSIFSLLNQYHHWHKATFFAYQIPCTAQGEPDVMLETRSSMMTTSEKLRPVTRATSFTGPAPFVERKNQYQLPHHATAIFSLNVQIVALHSQLHTFGTCATASALRVNPAWNKTIQSCDQLHLFLSQTTGQGLIQLPFPQAK